MVYHEMTWLSQNISKDGDPAARESAQLDQTQWLPIRALSNHQRREAKLCPGSDTHQHLFQHDAQAGHRRSG